jgi:HEAT repeat protein
LLNDPFESVCVTAAFALGRLGDEAASEALQKCEATTDPFLSMMATWALAKIHKADQKRTTQAVERLVTALADKNREMAGMAARALADLEVDPAKVRPLIDKLVAKHPEISDQVLNAFVALGPRAVPQATEALKDPQRRVRALQVLARIGAEAAPAAPALIDLLKSGDPATKTEALFTLGAIGPKAQAAIEPICDQLGDADPRVVEAAIYALGKIGPAAKSAIPKLANLVRSEDALVRLMAVCAILRIGPVTDDLVQTAMPVLTEGLQHRREYVRIEAAMTLGELGSQVQAALPALQTAASDSSAAVRSAAAAAIKKIKG